jgi:hypothetical protein
MLRALYMLVLLASPLTAQPHDNRLLDEAPTAYKDIRRVMRAQQDLVTVRHTLRPLLAIKGTEHSKRSAPQ